MGLGVVGIAGGGMAGVEVGVGKGWEGRYSRLVGASGG